jgi:hypothetical protein
LTILHKKLAAIEREIIRVATQLKKHPWIILDETNGDVVIAADHPLEGVGICCVVFSSPKRCENGWKRV